MARWSLNCLLLSLLLGMSLAVMAINTFDDGNVAGRKQSGLRFPLPEAQLEKNFICGACVEFWTDAQTVINDPRFTETLDGLISRVLCDNLYSPKLKAKCVELVNVSVSDFVTTLKTYIRPQVCTDIGICQPELLLWKDAKTCALCEDFAADGLAYLEANKTKHNIIVALHHACSKLDDLSRQCDLLVDVYAPQVLDRLDTITPEEFCQLTRLCRPAPVRLSKRNDCAICQFVVLELKYKLRDPKFQEKLLQVLGNGCDRMINHVDECKAIVNQYAPFLLANLETILDADVLCAKLGVCPAQLSSDHEPYLVMPSTEAVQEARRIHAL